MADNGQCQASPYVHGDGGEHHVGDYRVRWRGLEGNRGQTKAVGSPESMAAMSILAVKLAGGLAQCYQRREERKTKLYG
jgi:hypothetical protein